MLESNWGTAFGVDNDVFENVVGSIFIFRVVVLPDFQIRGVGLDLYTPIVASRSYDIVIFLNSFGLFYHFKGHVHVV